MIPNEDLYPPAHKTVIKLRYVVPARILRVRTHSRCNARLSSIRFGRLFIRRVARRASFVLRNQLDYSPLFILYLEMYVFIS